MIPINKLTQEVSTLMLRLDNDGLKMKKMERSKITNRITFLRTTITYLEQDNREDFLSSELDRLNKRVQLINDGYADWIPSKYYEKEKDQLKDYLKEMGIPKLKAQIKALRFILNK
jgi:hypothetical protein